MDFLSETEREELERKIKKTKDLSEWKRIFAILGYDDGKTIGELAEALRIAASTVETYLKEYESKNKTKNDPRGGGHSKLTAAESYELEDHLRKNTYLKVNHIIVYVKERFGKEYARSGMTAWLIAHGFTFKKPKKIPGKLNPEAHP
jgi:transposase